jgi:hypothetical protein
MCSKFKALSDCGTVGDNRYPIDVMSHVMDA